MILLILVYKLNDYYNKMHNCPLLLIISARYTITMDQIIPVQYIKKHFRISVNKIQQHLKKDHATYYNAVTQFGNMSLIIENYSSKISDKFDSLQFINIRNDIISKHNQIFPIQFQQQIIVNHPEQILCVTLMEKCLQFRQFICSNNQRIRISNFEQLIKCCHVLEKSNLFVQGNFDHNQLFYYQNSGKVNIDITKIKPTTKMNDNNQKNSLGKLVAYLEQIFIKTKLQNEISLIHDKMRIFAPENIKQAKTLQQLMIILNIGQQLYVEIQANKIHHKNNTSNHNKMRRTQIKELDGNQKFVINEKQYKNLVFIEGKCINCLKQITQPDKKLYIKPDCNYRLIKLQNLTIQLIQNKATKLQPIPSTQCDTITVNQNVQKIQFISFLIYYLSAIQPIVSSISYIQHENSLKIQYTNKGKLNRILKIIFYQSYVVKDQEISMIVERCKLKNCKLDLRYMKINDTLLMFLANSQKTLKIVEIHLSDCYGLTDNGINTLLISPLCKNLQAISLILDDGLFESSIQSLNLKSDLKKLFIQRNSYNQEHHHKTQINISKMKLTQLHSTGIKISLDNLNANLLKILKITQAISIEEIKNIRNLRLVQLKLRVIQMSKKSIIQTTSSFLSGAIIGKNNHIKSFAEGPSDKTLKLLDLSDSVIRFRTCKYLFAMQQLEKVYLDNCSGLGNQFEPISPKILYLSLSNTQISIQNLQTIIQKNQILLYLNLINNKIISKQQIYKFLTNKKKMIKNLVICDKCYSNKLIQKIPHNNSNNSNNTKQSGMECIQNVSLYVDNLISSQMQDVLYTIMYRVSETPKILTMLTCQPRTTHKDEQQQQNKINYLLHKLTKFIQISGKQVTNFKNLYINNCQFVQLYHRYMNKQFMLVQEQSNCIEILNKNNIMYIKIVAMQFEKIDRFMYKILALIRRYPTAQLIVYLQNNKIFTKQVIKMLYQYAKENVVSLNFMNCLFGMSQVVEYLFEFPYLETLNQGIYVMKVNQNNFGEYTQRYLKLGMRLHFIRQLRVQCDCIEQIQILYSILYHIIDKNSQNIMKIVLNLTNTFLNHQSTLFINKIFQITNLQQLQILIDNDRKNSVQKTNYFTNLNKLSKLKRLVLKIPFENNMNFQIKSLQQLSIDFSNQSVNQSQMNKIMKSLYTLAVKTLSLNLSNCQLSSLHKIFSIGPNSGSIQRLTHLETLRINLQFCNIKEHTIFQLMHSISKMQSIKDIQLNVSYVVSNMAELIKTVQEMMINIQRDVNLLIIAVNQNSKDFQYNKDFFKSNGVQFIF